MSIRDTLSWSLILPFASVLVACAHPSGTDYYPFVIPWDDSSSSVVNMTGIVHDAPAGQYGRVIPRGEDLVFERTGEPVRFWGIAISVAENFPPADKADARSVVAKLAKYGFNHVRLNGMDFGRFQLFDRWARTGELNPHRMEALDYFLAELKKQGIYYSLSINSLSVKYSAHAALKRTSHKVPHKTFKGVQMFDEAAVAMAARWHRAVFEHENPYTGTSIGADPANVFVPAVGEDSMFNVYFRQWKTLGETNKAALQGRLNQFLRQRHGSQDKLRRAWTQSGQTGLRRGEDLNQGTIGIPDPDTLDQFSPARGRDLMRFFLEVDRLYYTRIRDALEQSGYSGMFTGTNNWYGYANHLVSDELGDYVDAHPYFDHPVSIRREGKRRQEIVLNRSMLAPMGKARRLGHNIYRNNLYRLFVSALDDKPLLVSEWNHSGWSDYSYEGPLMLVAYSSLQGYRLLEIHTYLSMGQSYKGEFPTMALAANGNPVMMALSPTMSLAYLRGDITEAPDTVRVTVAASAGGVLEVTRRQGLDQLLAGGTIPPDAGLVHRIRSRLIADTGRGVEPVIDPATVAGPVYRSSTGEIVWDRTQPRFTVESERFQAVMTAGDELGARLSNLSATLADHGVVTAISLDGKALTDSSSILITALSNFRNTDATFAPRHDKLGRVNGRIVVDPGHGPVLLRRLRGNVTLEVASGTAPSLFAIGIDGTTTPVKTTGREISSDRQTVTFDLGTVDTPWYWLKR